MIIILREVVRSKTFTFTFTYHLLIIYLSFTYHIYIMECCNDPNCDTFKTHKIYKKIGAKKTRAYWFILMDTLIVWNKIMTEVAETDDWKSDGVYLSACKLTMDMYKLIGSWEV